MTQYLKKPVSARYLGRFGEIGAANLTIDFGKIGAWKMGGIGSGRRYQGGKGTTSDYSAIDARWLQRQGMLAPGMTSTLRWSRGGQTVASIQVRAETGHVILSYRSQSHGGEWKAMEYPVFLDWTDCHLGGRRAWFRCPAQGCGRRVALIYGGAIFACRHCHQLAYASQREAGYDRAARKADRLRDKLGWEPGILNGGGAKPKGMHWRTFKRLKAEHDALVGESLAGAAKRFGWLDDFMT